MCLFRLLTRGFLSSARDKNSLHQNGKEDSFLTVELVCVLEGGGGYACAV